jgi:protein gp37
MSDNTRISYANATWNPVVGCTKISDGCKNCYAEKMACRLARIPATRGLYQNVVSDGHWSGRTMVANTDTWSKPLGWRKPRRIFVCSMGDLFCGGVESTTIECVFGVMAACKQHTFLVLTKRPNRMNLWISEMGRKRENIAFDPSAGMEDIEWCSASSTAQRECIMAAVELIGHGIGGGPKFGWPLSNAWIGTTCEDQIHTNERIPHLLEAPAAVRWISCEPLLGPIDIPQIERLNLVVVGCESGSHRRECKIDWVYSLVDQCKSAGVQVYVKQISINGRVSKNMNEWPEKLRVREWQR